MGEFIATVTRASGSPRMAAASSFGSVQGQGSMQKKEMLDTITKLLRYDCFYEKYFIK